MNESLAIVIATLFGPIAAVTITLWYQARDQSYQRRLNIFRSLMQWRANWLHPEWVGALNMIPVEYSGKQDIITAFTGLLDKFSDPGFAETGEKLSAAYSRAEVSFIELVQKLARELKIDLGGFDLRGRVYAPKGWSQEQAAIQSLRTDSIAVLNGQRTLKIELINPSV
jgi:hypothetical protein